jgi:hypothetical protein
VLIEKEMMISTIKNAHIITARAPELVPYYKVKYILAINQEYIRVYNVTVQL